ncbi:MAG: hypothetical protein LBQ81_05715 [Zoogloeaceae bacterium]|jgi:uncharacterized membrane protein|nr:hypothetical protein [Zoogloeaceae bacterium]
MNAIEIVFAIIGVMITFIGFGFANKLESKFLRFLVKTIALVAGFLLTSALQFYLYKEGAGESMHYFLYMMIGYWLFFGGGIFGGKKIE